MLSVRVCSFRLGRFAATKIFHSVGVRAHLELKIRFKVCPVVSSFFLMTKRLLTFLLLHVSAPFLEPILQNFFIVSYGKGRISWSVCPWQAFPA
jgi:hypothetical protein